MSNKSERQERMLEAQRQQIAARTAAQAKKSEWHASTDKVKAKVRADLAPGQEARYNRQMEIEDSHRRGDTFGIPRCARILGVLDPYPTLGQLVSQW